MTEFFFSRRIWKGHINCVYERFGTVDTTNSYKTNNKRRGVLNKLMVDNSVVLWERRDTILSICVAVCISSLKIREVKG